MLPFYIFAGFICAAIIVALLTSYICYRMAFYAFKNPADDLEYPIPEGKAYAPFRDQMINWLKETRELPHDVVTVTSFDGLKLHGKFYEYAPGAPIELMFHGYRGLAERDLCGGAQRCFALGHSALIVDQRGCGNSEGKVITFGIHESRDCHTWLQYIAGRFGPESRVILTGISMGAATVLMAAGTPLPENVVGVLADCGYTSAKDIIKKVIRQMGLLPKLAYPFVKLGARLYGHFDLEETSPVQALKNCRVPVIFFHGEDDDFVPCDMSRINYECCASPKKLVTTAGAGHGLSYPQDPQRYLSALREFWDVHMPVPLK